MRLSTHQQEVMERLKTEPLIARKCLMTSEGRYLGLRVWRFEKSPCKTILPSTVSALRNRKLIVVWDLKDRREVGRADME